MEVDMQEKKIIGVDYDGVIGDTGSMKVRWIKERTGMDVQPWQTDRTTCVGLIGLEAYEEMGCDVYERDLTLAAPAVPGSINALRVLCDLHEVHVITARPYKWATHATEWLEQQGLRRLLTSIRCIKATDGTSCTKADICAELKVVALIDDDERHLRAVEIPHLTRILLKDGCANRPSGLLDGILYASSWPQAVALLK